MANTISDAIGKILEGRALDVLREASVMPRLINRDLADVAGKKGQAVDITVADTGTVRNVTAGTSHTNTAVTASKKTVTLNQWKEAGHEMSDKEFEEIMEGYLSAQGEEDLRALVNTVDRFIHDTIRKGTYNFAGTAGTTPFASNLGVFKTTRAKLSTGLAPMDNRRVVLDPDAEGNALILGNFLQAEQRGDQGGVINGVIGFKLGADWIQSQNVRTHVPGTVIHTTTVLTKAASAVDDTTIVIDRASFTGFVRIGDLFEIAGQQFVCTASATAASSAISVPVSPPVSAAIASGVAVAFAGLTVNNGWVDNLHFQKDCFAFASRPMARSSQAGLGSVFGTVVDPISGLAIRLEIQRQNKQTSMYFDILYGGTLVKPALSARILG